MSCLKKSRSRARTDAPYIPGAFDDFRSMWRALDLEGNRLIAEGYVSKLDLIEEWEGQSSAPL